MSADNCLLENPLKILLVEDDELSLILGIRILKKGGHVVISAHDGEEALKLLAENEIDVVLMDVQMPIMDGVEATMAIREGRAGLENRDVPIIALTAYAMTGDKEKFLSVGMDEYLSKPVDVDEFAEILERVSSTRTSAKESE